MGLKLLAPLLKGVDRLYDAARGETAVLNSALNAELKASMSADISLAAAIGFEVRVANSAVDRLTIESVGRLEGVANPLPSDGYFSRVMPRKYAEAFARGEGSLGGGYEVFVGAGEDLFSVSTRSQAQQRLSLFRDFEGSVPNTAGDAIVQFKLNDLSGLATPIERGVVSPYGPVQPRGYGFKQGGTTAGNAREWVIQNGTAEEIGAHSFRVIYLGE
jgi:hypothetical protein